VRRVHRTTDVASGSPDATPSVNGFAASSTGGAATESAGGVVDEVVEVDVEVVEVVAGAVVGSLGTDSPVVGVVVSADVVHPATIVADRARNVRRDIVMRVIFAACAAPCRTAQRWWGMLGG
jgi:hypothetical protein